jgi:alkyl hydroperoxide reductase subunit AhpF
MASGEWEKVLEKVRGTRVPGDDIFKSKGLASSPCADDGKDAVGYFKARIVLVIGIGPNTRLHLRLPAIVFVCLRYR